MRITESQLRRIVKRIITEGRFDSDIESLKPKISKKEYEDLVYLNKIAEDPEIREELEGKISSLAKKHGVEVGQEPG
jgi:hypothetical protein